MAMEGVHPVHSCLEVEANPYQVALSSNRSMVMVVEVVIRPEVEGLNWMHREAWVEVEEVVEDSMTRWLVIRLEVVGVQVEVVECTSE
jgi:hypothetical protein